VTVCIVGNSHAASLLKGYDLLADKDALPWEFFVTPNGYADKTGMNAIAFDAKKGAFLDFPFHRSAQGADLKIASYEAFVLVGAHFSVSRITGILRMDTSAAFRTAAIRDICQNTRLFRFASEIRALSDARILLSPSPSVTPQQRRAARARPVSQADLDGTQAIVTAFWAEMGVEFLPQPPETMDAQGLTREDCMISVANMHYTPDATAIALTALRTALAHRASA